MATTFPLSNYRLRQSSVMSDDPVMARDILDDGEMRIRQLGASNFSTIRCVFNPISTDTKITFQDYLRTNRATEFDMTIDTPSPSSPTIVAKIYRGYIWSSPTYQKQDGLYTVSFEFRGKVV
jgi:hypothetical protein